MGYISRNKHPLNFKRNMKYEENYIYSAVTLYTQNLIVTGITATSWTSPMMTCCLIP